MYSFDILPDDIIQQILDIRCDEIEKEIEKLENLEDDYEDILMQYEWNRHFNQSPIDYESDNDELDDQYYQDEIYLANLSSNI